MQHPTPNQAIVARFNDFTICIKMLLDARHTLPALVLLYSAIDVFASLQRPETQADTDGSHFKKWAEDYMIKALLPTVASEDLWSARCGLLHTHSPSSQDSRRGKARELFYYRAHAPTPDMQRALESALQLAQRKGKVPLDTELLYSAFEDGLRRFLADVQRNPELEKLAVYHSSMLFGVLTYDA
jgi:hypothetical protein